MWLGMDGALRRSNLTGRALAQRILQQVASPQSPSTNSAPTTTDGVNVGANLERMSWGLVQAQRGHRQSPRERWPGRVRTIAHFFQRYISRNTSLSAAGSQGDLGRLAATIPTCFTDKSRLFGHPQDDCPAHLTEVYTVGEHAKGLVRARRRQTTARWQSAPTAPAGCARTPRPAPNLSTLPGTQTISNTTSRPRTHHTPVALQILMPHRPRPLRDAFRHFLSPQQHFSTHAPTHCPRPQPPRPHTHTPPQPPHAHALLQPPQRPPPTHTQAVLLALVIALPLLLGLAAAVLGWLLWRQCRRTRTLAGSVRPPGAGPQTTLLVTVSVRHGIHCMAITP